MKKSFLISTILIFLAFGGSAQDHISWSSISLSKKINDRFTFVFKPIVRHNISTSTYLNYSPDYMVKYKLNSAWSFQLFGRSWIVPEGPDRQFLWFDVKHTLKLKDFTISNTARLHGAIDRFVEDGDFLRWHPYVKWNKHKKIQPLAGLQFFYQMNGLNELQRIRYALGAHVPLLENHTLQFQYWNEVFYNRPEIFRVHIWVVNLSYSF